MPANLVFRRKIWGAQDTGIPPRSTPGRVEKMIKYSVHPCVLYKVGIVINNTG